MAQKINLEKIQQAIDSRSLTELDSQTKSESLHDRQKRERVMDRLWQRLQEIYGHQLNSGFGETIPESWERLLTQVSPEQIKNGLNALADRADTWPPNAVEFRALCMPKTISPDGNNTAAYLAWDDPRRPENDPDHPSYIPKQIALPDHSAKESNKAANKRAMAMLRGFSFDEPKPLCEEE